MIRNRKIQDTNIIVRYLAIIILIVGLVGLLINIPSTIYLYFDIFHIHDDFLISLNFICCGLFYYLFSTPFSKIKIFFSYLIAGILIGNNILSLYFLSKTKIITSSHALIHPMPILTILNFILISISMVSEIIKLKSSWVNLILSYFIFSISMLVIFGYTYQPQIPTLIFNLRFSLMYVSLFLMLSLILFLRSKNNLLTKIILSQSIAGKNSRYIFILLISILVVICYFENLGEYYKLYDSEFGDALLSTLFVMIMTVIIIMNTYYIYLEENEKKTMQGSLEYIKYYDTKIGILNQDGFTEAIKKIIDEDKIKNFAVIKIDLDQFDIINNVIGNNESHILLIKFSHHLSKVNFLSNAIIGKLDIQRFGIIIKDISSYEEVKSIILRLLEIPRKLTTLNGNNIFLTASVGVSLFPNHGTDSESLLRNADAALFFAKKQVGNSFQFCTDHISHVLSERLEIENSIQIALLENQFQLYYQPQLDLHTGKICGAETLLRWMHPKKGLLTPAYFLKIAEETEFIIPIGEWVLKEVCQHINEHFLKLTNKITIGVNVSPIQFSEKSSVVSSFRYLTEEFAIDPNWIDLEITESILMHETQINLKRLAELKKIGFHLSLDDFGTGFSSFSYIHKMPFDKIKIDKSFIDPLPYNKNSASIVKAMIAMFHQLNKYVIAEGVENKEQLNFLKEAGCDIIQGNYYFAPLPIQAFKSLLD